MNDLKAVVSKLLPEGWNEQELDYFNAPIIVDVIKNEVIKDEEENHEQVEIKNNGELGIVKRGNKGRKIL